MAQVQGTRSFDATQHGGRRHHGDAGGDFSGHERPACVCGDPARGVPACGLPDWPGDLEPDQLRVARRRWPADQRQGRHDHLLAARRRPRISSARCRPCAPSATTGSSASRRRTTTRPRAGLRLLRQGRPGGHRLRDGGGVEGLAAGQPDQLHPGPDPRRRRTMSPPLPQASATTASTPSWSPRTTRSPLSIGDDALQQRRPRGPCGRRTSPALRQAAAPDAGRRGGAHATPSTSPPRRPRGGAWSTPTASATRSASRSTRAPECRTSATWAGAPPRRSTRSRPGPTPAGRATRVRPARRSRRYAVCQALYAAGSAQPPIWTYAARGHAGAPRRRWGPLHRHDLPDEVPQLLLLRRLHPPAGLDDGDRHAGG